MGIFGAGLAEILVAGIMEACLGYDLELLPAWPVVVLAGLGIGVFIAVSAFIRAFDNKKAGLVLNSLLLVFMAVGVLSHFFPSRLAEATISPAMMDAIGTR